MTTGVGAWPRTADRHRDKRRGVLLMIAAVTLVATMDLVVKTLSREMPIAQIAWGRYVVQAVALFAFAAHWGMLVKLRSQMPGVHVVRALLLLTANVAFMAAVAYLQLTEANVIGFMAPLLLTALTYPVLGEAVGTKRWIAVLTGFAGVLIVMRPTSSVFQWAALLPLLMAACSALYHVTTPVIRRTEDPAISLYYLGLIGAIGFTLVLPWVWVAPSPAGWLMLGCVGLLGTAGHFLMVRAFEAASPSTLAPLFYGHLLWALVYGWFFFGDLPDLFTIVGGALVIASGLYVYRTG
jgi:drug/metabolite transporter (DMT)-like permease